MVSFGWILWNSSDQLFSKIYAAKFYSSCCCFASDLTRNSILKNLFKSNQKMTLMGFFFSDFAGCDLTEERSSIIVCFGWFFCEIFQISFFLKQLRANHSTGLFTIALEGDLTSALEEVRVTVQINFELALSASLKFLRCGRDQTFADFNRFSQRNQQKLPLRNSTTIIIWLTKQI